MGEKRRDNKNRILRSGEIQRADGRYLYRYIVNGKPNYLYSWKLEATDRMPTGRKEDLSLREKEKEVTELINQRKQYSNGKSTVYELVTRYISTKTGVRHNTQAGYKTVLNILAQEEFGKRKIDEVKLSDAKLWLIKLQSKDKRSYSSVHNIRGVVRPAFQMALDDEIIDRNPFDFELAQVLINDSVQRQAISEEQERKFLKFIKEDEHYSQYYEGMYILFHTGLRISEFCGFTLKDIDMKERKIIVNHQLQRMRDGTYLIEDTKTTAGERILPMTEQVYQCFKSLVIKRKKPRVEPIVDGYCGFLVLDKNGMPYLANHWEKRFQYALGKYNRTFKEELPEITPHVCRHTYCTRMAKSGVSAKTLQYLMGHSEIGVTMNVYTHINADDAKDEVQRLVMEGKAI